MVLHDGAPLPQNAYKLPIRNITGRAMNRLLGE